MVYLIYFSDALGMIHIEPEPPATANDSCHMSRDIIWLSGGGDEGDFYNLTCGLLLCPGSMDWSDDG